MPTDMNDIKKILVNLGCGPAVKPTQWVDFDGSWNVRASQLPLGLAWLARKVLGHKGTGFPRHVRYINVTKRLPFPDQSVDAVYFSHVLEHLHLDEGKHLLTECHRILKPGGVIRVVVPDTEHYIANYLSDRDRGKIDACQELNRKLWFRPLSVKSGFLRQLYTAATDFHSHKFMYDRPFLLACMQEAGFDSVQEIRYGESLIPEVLEVEIKGRLGDGLGFGFDGVRK